MSDAYPSSSIKEVEVAANPDILDNLKGSLSSEQLKQFQTAQSAAVEQYRGRIIWNISSTATGGGVAEMLFGLVSAMKGLGAEIKWIIIQCPPKFFQITKAIHNGIHGNTSSVQLGDQEKLFYQQVLDCNRPWLSQHIKPHDIVILHDPQTAGLTEIIKDIGALAIWRCHIGRNEGNECSDETWRWFLPLIERIDGAVFSRKQYIPQKLRTKNYFVIPPAIDPLSLKNCDLSDEAALKILNLAGLVQSPAIHGELSHEFKFNGKAVTIVHKAETLREGQDMLGAEVPLVLQISRWDKLKDMLGVMKGFAQFITPLGPAKCHLILAGPETKGVADDPEALSVLNECKEYWHSLAKEQRQCITLVSLPMSDINENALMVNALQHHAAIIVQKSLEEGFGNLTAQFHSLHTLNSSGPILTTFVSLSLANKFRFNSSRGDVEGSPCGCLGHRRDFGSNSAHEDRSISESL
jgi:trehalose synthase